MPSPPISLGNERMVIPKEIREEMGIRHGTLLIVEKENSDIIRLKIVRTPDDEMKKNHFEDDNDARDFASNESSETGELRVFLEKSTE